MIGLLLVNAIELADPGEAHELSLFDEQPIYHDDLPGVGPIGGPVDFLVSLGQEGLASKRVPESPYLAVIEAKSSSRYSSTSALAQLSAQILTLHEIDRYSPLAFPRLYLGPRTVRWVP